MLSIAAIIFVENCYGIFFLLNLYSKTMLNLSTIHQIQIRQ